MARAGTIILVHGAWADGSSWAKVVSPLLDCGHRPIAVQLPLTSLEDDVATVRRAIALESGPVAVVGHSYGGAVITEAGTDPKVAALVYIAAFVPDVGESAASLGENAEPAPLGAEIRPDEQGYLKITEAGIANAFAQDLSALEKQVLFATQSPTSGAALGAAVSAAAWKSRPSWDLVTTNDRAIPPELQRSMAKRAGATTVEVASSHLPMLSRPQDVVALILRAVA